MVLHLLPGALITLFFALTAPLARGLGLPSLLAILLAIPVVLIPFELGYLLREGKRRNGRLSLEGVVLYRQPVPPGNSPSWSSGSSSGPPLPSAS